MLLLLHNCRSVIAWDNALFKITGIFGNFFAERGGGVSLSKREFPVALSLGYYKRLRKTGLTTLETWRLRSDIIKVLKIFRDLRTRYIVARVPATGTLYII